jgi:hypothetical protein
LKAQANKAKHMTFMRKIGYTQMGAMARTSTMMAKATHWWVNDWDLSEGVETVVMVLLLGAEQACRLEQKNDGHDDENHRAGSFRVKHFGQAFDQAQAKT